MLVDSLLIVKFNDGWIVKYFMDYFERRGNSLGKVNPNVIM